MAQAPSPSPDCLHWQDCGKADGGCCAANVHAGPSFGVCRVCVQRKPRDGSAPVIPPRRDPIAHYNARPPLATNEEIEALALVEKRVGGCGCAGGYTDVTRPT